MEADLLSEEELRQLVDPQKGIVSPRVFVEQELYKREMEQIFGRCWLYIVHESQVSQPGDFTLARMGDEAVLVCRGAGGRLNVFLNMCPVCSSLLVRADVGTAEDFTCGYHGWRFNLDGRLLIEDEATPGSLVATDDLILNSVAQLDSYKGMIFASFDAEAPPLDVFLGDIRWGLDLMLEQGNLRVANVSKWSVHCNWKFPAEVSISDIYHGVAHLGSLHADRNADLERELDLERGGFTIITEFGHGLNAEYIDDKVENAADPLQQWRQDAALQRRLGQFRMQVYRSVVTLFPNAMLSPATRELHIWHPRSVNETEVWLVTFYDEAEPAEVRRAFQRSTQIRRGPGGLYSQDESENWEQSTRGSQGVVITTQPLNYQMGLGRGEIIEDEQSPPRIETLINEHRQLWFFRNWAHAIGAQDWTDWQQRLPKPTGRV